MKRINELAGARARIHKFGFIDALRGYAVLLVMTSHIGMRLAELPYPVKRLTNFGWYGVQLFFLMSCVTLLLSWRSDQAKGTADLRDFWTRRVLRIAPMYYAAGLLYFVVQPPEGGFDLVQALGSLLFVNAWHPALMPTVPNAWTVVPGGWSVGVEFTFYALFPLYAALVGTWRRAAGVLAAALALAYVATVVAEPGLVAAYGQTSAEMFLFYWFPHQFPVFALGGALYHALVACWRAPHRPAARWLARRGNGLAAASIVGCLVVASLPFPGRLPAVAPLYLPKPYLAALLFAALALAIGVRERSPFNNTWIRALGEVSFSAYLLHFAVLHGLTTALPRLFALDATGFGAIAACAALWLCVVPITYALARLTYHGVEQPMIDLARRLVAQRRTTALAHLTA